MASVARMHDPCCLPNAYADSCGAVSLTSRGSEFSGRRNVANRVDARPAYNANSISAPRSTVVGVAGATRSIGVVEPTWVKPDSTH